jgi:Rod binding domain-containing protein
MTGAAMPFVDTAAVTGGTPNVDALKGRKDVDKAAVDFEAMVLSQMLNTMTSGLKTEKPFGGGDSENIWRSFLNDEYAKAMAKSGGLGISSSVRGELLRMQGMNDAATPSTAVTPPPAPAA